VTGRELPSLTGHRFSSGEDIAILSTYLNIYSWISHKGSFDFLDLAPSYFIPIGSETTFPSALCVISIHRPGYLIWSRTFHLGVGLADLGDFGWYWGIGVKTRQE
jgi:hypothetical protein